MLLTNRELENSSYENNFSDEKTLLNKTDGLKNWNIYVGISFIGK